MIYTLTFNPALDYVMFTDNFTQGTVNRSEREEIYFGGKGINVSAVLAEFGIESTALGFIAGFTGEQIRLKAEAFGIKCDFVELKEGFSRINVKIKSKLETDLNGAGPKITDSAMSELFAKLSQLAAGDFLILAGSVPKGLPPNTYEKILSQLKDKDVKFAVDTSGESLLGVLKYKPFLIKPNKHELEEIFSTELKTIDEISAFAKKLQEKGAVNVLVSLAGDGAILLDEFGKFHKVGVYKGRVINSVGAGDSMVAGFLAGYINCSSYDEALKYGSAAGSATAFSEGLAKKELILSLLSSEL